MDCVGERLSMFCALSKSSSLFVILDTSAHLPSAIVLSCTTSTHDPTFLPLALATSWNQPGEYPPQCLFVHAQRILCTSMSAWDEE
jgi:hypothetical protein